MNSNIGYSSFEWKQLQIDDIVTIAVCLLYSLLFFVNYVRSRLPVHIVLATSTFLEGLSSFLYAFAQPLCQQPGNWVVFVEGQLERLTEVGAFVVYILFVISRLSYFDSMLPGLRKWIIPLRVITILILASHLVRQCFFDYATYYGYPAPSEDITTTLYLVSMLYVFIVNFAINYIIARVFIKHAFSMKTNTELEQKCRRLQVLVFCSLVSTGIGSILYNINFDSDNLLLFHFMDVLTTITVTGHFYFEWLYQVLLTNILALTETGSSFREEIAA